MSSKLLRPPGYGLQIRIDELEEQMEMSLAGLVLTGALLGLFLFATVSLAVGFLTNEVPWPDFSKHPGAWVLLIFPLLMTGAGLGSIYVFVNTIRLNQQIDAHRLGLRGEQAVAEVLQDQALVAAGYRSFNDVPGDGAWNVDHVVIGPAGVFVIETKARTKQAGKHPQPKHEVLYDGERLRFPAWDDTESVLQVRRNAHWVHDLLKEHVPGRLRTTPVLVLPGWYVRSNGNYPVKAMSANYLGSYLIREPAALSPADMKSIAARIEERCRTLEF